MINLNHFNNKKIVSIILVLLLCLSACSEENDLDKEDYKKLNLQEISFPKSSIDNKSFDIKTYNDEILLINFWFPSCPPCIYELDILKTKYIPTQKIIIISQIKFIINQF